MVRTQELRQVQYHVDSLKTDMTAMQTDLLKQQKELNELLRLMRADQQVRFGELSTKVSSLENSLTESQQRLTQIDQKTQAIKARWDEKARSDSLSQSQRVAETGKLFQLAHDDFMARRFDIAAAGFSDIRTQHPEDSLAEDAAYWIAECNYAQQKDSAAEADYKSYLREYSQGKLTCSVLYKLGMIYDRNKKAKSRDLVWKKLIEQCSSSEEAKAARAKM